MGGGCMRSQMGRRHPVCRSHERFISAQYCLYPPDPVELSYGPPAHRLGRSLAPSQCRIRYIVAHQHRQTVTFMGSTVESEQLVALQTASVVHPAGQPQGAAGL